VGIDPGEAFLLGSGLPDKAPARRRLAIDWPYRVLLLVVDHDGIVILDIRHAEIPTRE
jgi:hypothetical protein